MEGDHASEPAQIPAPPTMLEMSEVVAGGGEAARQPAGVRSHISSIAAAVYGGESDIDLGAFADSQAQENSGSASESPYVDAGAAESNAAVELGLFAEQYCNSESSDNPAFWSSYSSDDDRDFGSSGTGSAGDDLTSWSLMMEDATTAAQSSEVSLPPQGRAASTAAAAPGRAPTTAGDGRTNSSHRGPRRKRARSVPVAVPETSSIYEGWQWGNSATWAVPSDISTMTSSASTLPHQTAAVLLRGNGYTLSGPRPGFLTGRAETVKGKIFKDDCRRRPRGTDLYVFKGGANNSTYSAVVATTASGKDVVVKRSYGSIVTKSKQLIHTSSGSSDDDSSEGEPKGALKVHQYCFHVDGKSLWPRMFHVQPSDAAGEEMTKAVAKTGAAAPVTAQPGTVHGVQRPSRKSKGSGKTKGAGGIKTDISESNSGGGAQQGQRTLRSHRVETRPVDMDGPLQLKNTDEQSPWVTFHHHRSGKQMGAIQPSPDLCGISLKSRAGDFAEWHTRAPTEAPFEAGDLVALGPHGLTRETHGARQLGIISRQMIVAGSMPEIPEEHALGDTVAYTGRVVLKLRGACTAGDHLVPSGLQDGTAVARSTRGGESSVGRALASVPLPLDNKGDFQMVECSVLSPASTVSEGDVVGWISCCSGWPWATGERMKRSMPVPQPLALVFCSLLATVLVLGAASHISATKPFVEYSAGNWKQLCPMLDIPAHMKVSGQCDGSQGSRCAYEGCDEGFDMRRAEAPLTQLVTGNSTIIRTCTAAGRYTGQAMTCVQRQCPVVTVNCSILGGCCSGCRHGIQVTFPATPVSLACDARDVRCMDRSRGIVTENCPRATHSGRLTARCLPNGQWKPGGLEGKCTQRTCASRSVHLDGYDIRHIGGAASIPLAAALVTFPDAPAGSGTLTLSCPSPQYRGSLTMTCANGSTEWTNLEGNCEWRHCAARPYNSALTSKQVKPNPKALGVTVHDIAGEHAASQLSPFVLQLPNLTIGQSVFISCCSSFTPGGGCAGPSDGIGEVLASCSLDGEYTVSGQCEPVEDIGLSLSAAPFAAELGNGTENESTAGLSAVYQMLLTSVGQEVSSATANAFTLPPTGVLGTLHLRRGTTVPWRPIVTTTRTGHRITIDTHRPSVSAGLQAVSVGNVACRQMGFGGAVLVTNCRGLQILHERTNTSVSKAALAQAIHFLRCGKDDSRWNGDNAVSKSKSLSSKTWIAVEGTESVSSDTVLHGQWLPGSNHTFRGPPPWVVHNNWAESSCVGNEEPVVPVGVASDPCEYTSDTLPGTTSSATKQLGICARTAGAVAHCYRDQLTRYVNGVLGNSQTHKDRQLVVACSGTGAGVEERLEQSGAKDAVGTWVVGDAPLHDDLKAPKVFANTMMHRVHLTSVDETLPKTEFGELSAAAVQPAGYYGGAFGRNLHASNDSGQYSWSDRDIYCEYGAGCK